MKLKEFFKPDWRKLAVFILILIVGTFYPLFFVYRVGIMFDPQQCVYGLEWAKITSVLSAIKANFEAYGKFELKLALACDKFNFNIFLLIITLVIWYLLSCLAVWIYDKVKKK